LFLHVLDRPYNGKLLVPGCTAPVSKVYTLSGKRPLVFVKKGNDIIISLPVFSANPINTVLVMEYAGKQPVYDATAPVTVSAAFAANTIEAVHAKTFDSAQVKSLTFSHYFGDWKHAVCVINMASPSDSVSFTIRFTDPADYKVILEYACPQESARQEASVTINGKDYLFRTLRTSEFDKSAPLMFIKHAVAITTITVPGVYTITIKPLQVGKEIFKLKNVVLEPIK